MLAPSLSRPLFFNVKLKTNNRNCSLLLTSYGNNQQLFTKVEVTLTLR